MGKPPAVVRMELFWHSGSFTSLAGSCVRLETKFPLAAVHRGENLHVRQPHGVEETPGWVHGVLRDGSMLLHPAQLQFACVRCLDGPKNHPQHSSICDAGWLIERLTLL